MRILLLVVGLAGVALFVLGPDTALGLAALPLGVALVVGSGSVWLVRERHADSAPRGTGVRPRR